MAPPSFLLFTPALTRPFSMGTAYRLYGLRLSDGARGVPAVEREIVGALPPGTTYSFHITSVVEGQVDRAVKPEAIALAVFGIIAMAAALLIAVQAIARQPLSPIGPVRPVYPAPGFEVDVVVLGFGLLALIGGIGAASVGLAYRQAPGRARQRVRTHASRGSSLVRVAASSGAPVSAVAGVRFAVEPGHGRTAVPVRSAISGAILAVLIVAASLTFGSGLDTLVSRPAAGAVAALGLTLTASVRRRRRDLALLKALGFTRRQLAACVAWQTTVAATIGVIAGIPLGIALGRWLWILFAHQIYAVPRPTVPALPLVCIGLGALVLANAAAALPGRYAARTPAALVLRTE